MPRSKILRAPVLGIALPNHDHEVTFEHPLDLTHEIPIALTRRLGTVLIREVKPEACLVRSTHDRPCGYILIVAPKKVALALMVAPWRDVLKFLRSKRGMQMLYDKLIEFVVDRG